MVYTVPTWLASQQDTVLQDYQGVAVAPLLTLRFLFALLRWLDPKPCLPPSVLSLRAAWQVCCCPSRLCRGVPWYTVHCLCECLRPAAGMLAT